MSEHSRSFGSLLGYSLSSVILLIGCLVLGTTASHAQTSFVTVSKSSNGAGCAYPNSPWSSYYGYVTFTVRHKITCSTGEVTLDTQTINATYESTCGSIEPPAPACIGDAEHHTQDNGSSWNVSAVATNGYRTYSASEYGCGFYQNGWGSVSFTKVTAATACP